ncbi:MAG: hypothetical protein OXE77_04930 [Flavobacteriaceae bacterium]|nr:hypothetical protein [Flavobacteriaceae bacterium]
MARRVGAGDATGIPQEQEAGGQGPRDRKTRQRNRCPKGRKTSRVA